MDAKPCGHCLIINNVDFDPQSHLSSRKGSNIDCLKLESRFNALNFIVEVKTNLRQKVRSKSFCVSTNNMYTFWACGFKADISTFQQIKHELSALSKIDHSQYDCCVVIMLSHGTEVRPVLELHSAICELIFIQCCMMKMLSRFLLLSLLPFCANHKPYLCFTGEP